MANELLNIDCLILDDGFQSRYINKNLDIVLLDKSDVLNTALLPAGRLREPIINLKSAFISYFSFFLDRKCLLFGRKISFLI